MEEVAVEVIDHSDMPNPNTSAFYNSGHHRITFSRQWMAMSDLLDIVYIAFQQVRYAYQSYQILLSNDKIKTYFKETPERIERWRKDKDIDLDSELDDNEKRKMKNNPYLDIDIDAMAFGNVFMRRLIDVDYEVPWVIRDKVIAREIELEKQFKNESLMKHRRIIKFSEFQ